MNNDRRTVLVTISITLIFIAALGASCSPTTEGPDPCEGVECSGHGLCDPGDDNEPRCICDSGYRAEGLECVEGCSASTCSGHGTCSDESGTPACTCDTGYAGDWCGECADGYHRDGGGSGSGGSGDCVPDETCDPDPCAPDACHPEECTECDPDPCDAGPCGDHGSCRCVGGEAVCDCDEGYDGPTCAECAEDYVPRGAECVPCNEVLFQYFDATATSVWVSGDWLGWPTTPAEGALELVNDGMGNWSVTTSIDVDVYIYKFIVNGAAVWLADPRCEETTDCRYVDSGFEYPNCECDLPCEGEPVTPGAPDWRDVVMYFVMVDRFSDSDGERDMVPGATDGSRDGPSGQYMGGDLAGVTERMGYLNDLGVTAIWLSAPYENRDTAGAGINFGDTHMYSGYHGYWPSPDNIVFTGGDPSPRPEVEPRISTSADAEGELRDLIDEAHGEVSALGGDTGIRVLFDYVMHHVDLDSGLYAAHPGWFYQEGGHFILCPPSRWDDPFYGTRCAFTDYLPPFDFYNPEVRAWSVADAVWWAREFGLDGYRLDAIKHVPLDWLTELRTALTAAFPEPWGDRFYLVGETFNYDDPARLRDFIDPETMLDGQFDFPFKARLCEAVLAGSMGLDGFSSWMDGMDDFFGRDAIMTTWIGNHDIPRAIHFASREITNCREGSNLDNGWARETWPDAWRQPTDAAPYERLGVAFAVMMTTRGIPLIYYGDEIGLSGGGDPDNRRMMVFDDGSLNAHQIALRDGVSALGHIRAENRALSRGERTTRHADADTWVYTMGEVRDTPDVTVAINRSDAARSVTVPDGSYTDLMTDTSRSGGAVELPPRSFLILRHE
jgi:glycosidase